MIDMSMCRPSKIDGRCKIRLLYLLKTLILYISCMRITPRVCTSVLSLVFVIRISVPFHESVPTNRTLSSTGPLSVQLKRSYRLHASIKAYFVGKKALGRRICSR